MYKQRLARSISPPQQPPPLLVFAAATTISSSPPQQPSPPRRRNNHRPSSSSPPPSPSPPRRRHHHLLLAAAAPSPSRRRRKEKMVHERIFCHADIQALQDRSDQLLYVELVSLESVRIASDSCELLLNLIEGRDSPYPKEGNLTERRYWHCPQMDLLSLMAGVALELHKIKHDLHPLLLQEAKLEGSFLKGLLLLKNSAVTLVSMAKDAKEIVEGLEEEDVIDALLGKVKEFGQVVEDTADLVLKGTHNIAWLQAPLPSVLDPVDRLLSTPVHFPNPDE